MVDIPHSWEAYARLQRRLSQTTCITTAAALEAALNVVHRPDFRPEDFTDDVFKTVADTAGRRERDHLQILRRHAAPQQTSRFTMPDGSEDAAVDVWPKSLDDQVHASRELARIEAMVPAADWELLIGVAVGGSYEELAIELASSSGALRSRVCRLRQMVA